MKPRVGDMVHVPSDTYYYKYGSAKSAPLEVKKLEEPKSFLVIGETQIHYELLIGGNSWLVEKQDVYKL